MAKFSLQLLGNPSAEELMKIAASVGLANNFGALKSLVTKGIQVGHMKMHLLNILNSMDAGEKEKQLATTHFSQHKVSYNAVKKYLESLRQPVTVAKI
jgi:hydroxymethylglutaryl-CoA reductase